MDTLSALRTLIRVAETKSFSVPARELNIGQPAVSKAISRLEQELGIRLVGRTTRHVRPTPAGQRVIDELGPLVRSFDEGLARVTGEQRTPTGTVRIAVAPGFGRACIVPLLSEFRATAPDVAMELAVSDRVVDLVAEGIDLAIRSGPLRDSSHVARHFGDTPVLTIASAAYLARRGEPQDPADLAAHDAVLFFTRGTPRAWRFGTPPKQLTPSRPVFLSSSADDLLAAVLAGAGIAQVPGWLAARAVSSGEVRAVLRAHEPPPIPLFFVRATHTRAPARVRTVETFLSRRLPAALTPSFPRRISSRADVHDSSLPG